jgi:hypothetical protein
MFIAIFCAFWLWIMLVANFPINTRGWTGNLMLILDGLYVMALPLLGIATILSAGVAVVKRLAPLSGVITIVLVATALGLWAWSLSPSGQFDLTWRK